MKILNISTNTHGGAGSAALRIHKAFLSEGVESFLYAKSNFTDFEEGVYVARKQKWGYLQKVVKRLLTKILFRQEYLMYSLFDNISFASLSNLLERENIKPDVVILHWIADFINLRDLVELKNKYPNIQFYWYLMDMAPLTAGCHYAWGCDNYVSGCSVCPAAKMRFGKFLVSKKFQSKYKTLKQIDIKYIAPNMFVRDQVRKMPAYDSTGVAYIPIDDAVFKPSSTAKGEFTILFGSSNFSDRRKGADLFYNVLLRLDHLLSKSNIGSVAVLMPGFEDSDLFEFDN